MSSHAEVVTEIKSVVVLDRTLKTLGCAASKAVTGAHVAGRRVDGQQFEFPCRGNYKGTGVAELKTGTVHVDSDYRSNIAAFVDAYSVEAIKQLADENGLTYQVGKNANGEQFVEVFTNG